MLHIFFRAFESWWRINFQANDKKFNAEARSGTLSVQLKSKQIIILFRFYLLTNYKYHKPLNIN